MNSNPFRSFWMAGYECADHLNAFGVRVDLLNATGHLQFADADYKQLSLFNIKTVREGLRWSVIEKTPFEYDFEPVRLLIKAAEENGIQQVWDICHFGFPGDLTPLHPMFARRFAACCAAFVQFYRSVSANSILIITPINEVSFLSWLGGEVRGTSPFCTHHGWQVKYALMKAYIEGIEAIKQEDSRVRILITEPLINVVTNCHDSRECVERAVLENEYQFQVFDILSGKTCPELRGKPEYLDIIGLNFYPDNQWAVESGATIKWQQVEKDVQWVDMNELLFKVYQRYNRPFIISETSGVEEMRASWIKYIGEECALLLQQNLPLWGVCFYPIIDRPDWDALEIWHRAGLWKVEENNGLTRIAEQPLVDALLQTQQMLAEVKMEQEYNISKMSFSSF